MNNLSKDIPKTSQLEQKLLVARIKELESLPLPSCSMLELSSILKTEPVDLTAVANCLAHDHVMLAQMLRIFYRSFPGVNPTSPLDAVAMLPIDRIQTLTYIPHILENFGEREVQEWNHAYSCRILMESILDDNGIDNPELIRAAHLHDIGKNVFRDWSPKKYKLVENHAESSREVPLYKLENAVLQVDHAKAGADLLKAWGFSEAVWRIVEQHHNHDDDPPETYVFETALLQFVNYIDCKVRGIPCEPPSAKLMKKARIAEIDEEGYLGSQKALIDRLRANDNEAIRKSVVAKMIELEKQNQVPQEEAAPEPAAEEVKAEEPAPAPAAEEVKAEEPAPVPEQKEERGIAFSPRFRSASFSISAGNGFTPAPTPEESLSSALNEEDDVLGNPDFDPEQYNSSDVPSTTAKKEEELLQKMGLK
ncbi:MAG: HDOD domain-containing protein [Lentisphaeria bacterium]|nr:HDOD domain-containing protein [Lentisphaeria bacterium]